MQINQGLLTIDLTAIRANFAALKAKSYDKCGIAAAVKADAYGLGIARVAPVIHKEGCRTFFVATLEEGIALCRILPGTEIYVLGGFAHGTAALYHDHALRPVLNSLDDIMRAASEKIIAPVAIHFDTGMNRLGLGPEETKKLLDDIDLLKNLNVQLVMSHFACADEKDHPLTHRQFESFAKITKYFPQAVKSLANSSGIFRSPDYHFDLLRPGVAIYGVNPTPEEKNPMRPVVSLEAYILQVRDAGKGESVGYSAAHILKENKTLATVGIGYADGFLRSLSGHGKLYWNGIACPILGRVSMDLTVIDLSHVPEDKRPVAGDKVEVIGPSQSVDDLAHDAGTIGYEILTSLGARYERTYIGG